MAADGDRAPAAGGDGIVVFAWDSLGDLVLRQPLLRGLADLGGRVTVVVRPVTAALVPMIDPRLETLVTSVYPYVPPDAVAWEATADLERAVAGLRPATLVSALYSRTWLDEWLMGRFPASARVGLRNPDLGSVLDRVLPAGDPHRAGGLEPFVDREVECPRDSHESERNALLFRALAGRELASPEPRLRVPEAGLREAAALLGDLGLEPGGYVFGCPGGTSGTNLKLWPPEAFARVAGHLWRVHRLPVLAAGLPHEAALLDEVAARAAASGVEVRRYVGDGAAVARLLGLIRHSRFYLGNDSGPMHLAGALDVPVVALFGGGTWPRFLPLARRSFVAARRLPCFGCGWSCWLDAPLCLTGVPMEEIEAAVDWVLGPEADARRVETGPPLGSFAEAVLASARAGSRRDVEAMSARLAYAEADGAARLAVIERFAAESAALTRGIEAERAAFDSERAAAAARLEAANETAAVLRSRAQAVERESGERLEAIRRLERRILEISSARATVKRLAGIAARKAGVYSLLKRREPVVRRLLGRPGPGAAPAAAPARHRGRPPAEAASIHSAEVAAFAAARALEGDVDDRALARLWEIASGEPSVLALEATARSLQAATMLARGGARVTCLGAGERSAQLADLGAAPEPEGLGDWLVRGDDARFEEVDALLLDAGRAADLLPLLAGRLGAGMRLLVLGAAPGDAVRSAWGEPEESVGNLDLYPRAPEAWLDPGGTDPDFYRQPDWPALPFRGRLPAALPSGRPWPKISIVTVTYNQAGYLEETLRSVLLQGYPNLEYIVLDGASTDATPGILDRYRESLAYCASEKDEGQSDALNKGFARATGDILAWLNSDDRYLPGTLWRVALAFDAFGADLVTGGCAMVQDRDPVPFGVHHSALPVGEVVPLDLDRLLDIDGAWLRGDFFWQPEVFWTRSAWERSGSRVAKDLFYSMDYELWVRMAASGARIVRVPETLAVYRMHPKQKTSGDELPYLPELREVSARMQRSLGRS